MQQLTTQAFILAVVLGVLLLVTNITLILQKAFNVGTILTTLIAAAVIALMVYDTDCLTRGKCAGWSWIRTILYSIVPIVAILYSVWGIAHPTKKQDQAAPTTPAPQPVATIPTLTSAANTTTQFISTPLF